MRTVHDIFERALVGSAPQAASDADGPRGRRRQANLERIVAAAMQVVLEDGVDGLSIKRVADLADYTPGALYRYFPSKDALLAAVTERVVFGLAERLAEASASAWAPRGGSAGGSGNTNTNTNTNSTPRDSTGASGNAGAELEEGEAASAASAGPLAAIGAMAEAYLAFSVADPHGFVLVSAMVGDPRVLLSDDDAAARVLFAVVRVLAPVREALERAADAGLLAEGDAQDRALLLFAGLHGALQLRKHERRVPGIVRAAHLADAMVRALLRGWGAPASALPPPSDQNQ